MRLHTILIQEQGSECCRREDRLLMMNGPSSLHLWSVCFARRQNTGERFWELYSSWRTWNRKDKGRPEFFISVKCLTPQIISRNNWHTLSAMPYSEMSCSLCSIYHILLSTKLLKKSRWCWGLISIKLRHWHDDENGNKGCATAKTLSPTVFPCF